MTSLNHKFAILSNWFYENFRLHNPDKCSFITFGIKDELQTDLVSNKITIKNSKEEKVQGITFHNKLNFSTNLISIAKKTNVTLNAFTRVQKYMITEQKTFLTSSFIKS